MWWLETAHNYHFLDGATDPASHLEGPGLLHYRSSTLSDVILRQRDCWQTILRDSIEVPSQTINIYDGQGELTLYTLPWKTQLHAPHPLVTPV